MRDKSVLKPLPNDHVLQDRYKVVKLIGQGGMGNVYLIEHAYLGKKYALKEMHLVYKNSTEKRKALEQFKSEAKILASLEHPHLPVVADFFEASGVFYYVMDYIDGEDLGQIVRKNKRYLEEAVVLSWAEALAKTLNFLHNRKPPIIFRDLTPRNVMISKSRDLKLIDFGIAKNIPLDDQTGTIIKGSHTPGFAPPEQYCLDGGTDCRTDVYSLGATLYFCLTKTVPPGSLERLLKKATLQDIRVYNNSVSGSCALMIEKALRIEPEERFQTAREFLYEIRKIMGKQQISSDIPLSKELASTSVETDDAIAYFSRGNSSMAENDYDSAIRDYSKAISLNPDYAKAYNNRGSAYANKNDYDSVRADLKKCRDLGGEIPPSLQKYL